MFTGIVTATGEVLSVSPIREGRDMRMHVRTPPGWLEGAQLGASIACNGCCLTAVALEPEGFEAEASAETLSLTVLGEWKPGTRINLERPLRPPAQLARFIAPKGSVTLNGVSLTVNEVMGNGEKGSLFGVNLIPHTREVTTFGALGPGAKVNLEIDMLARYVARLKEFEA